MVDRVATLRPVSGSTSVTSPSRPLATAIRIPTPATPSSVQTISPPNVLVTSCGAEKADPPGCWVTL